MSRRWQATHAPGLPCGLPSPGSREQNCQGGEHLRPMQEVMLRVSWSVLNHHDGQPHHARRGEVMLDLGLESAPDPELTRDEMQQIAFAAKIAALKILGRRPKTRKVKESK